MRRVRRSAALHLTFRGDAVVALPLPSRREVALTAEGQGLYPVLRDGFDTFAAAIERIAARKARRIITLTATMAFTAKWLVPRIASFRDANPMIGLRLYASDEVVDLRSGEADAAIRYGRGPFPGMIAEPLVTDRYAPVCSPRLKLRGPEDLHRDRAVDGEAIPDRGADPIGTGRLGW